MSDFFASVIPTDTSWQPTRDAAARVEDLVRALFPDPDSTPQEISVRFYDRITVVDAGENLQRITCPHCHTNIEVDWYQDLIEQTDGGFDTLQVTVPCCHTRASLDTLGYDWPCGFARLRSRSPIPPASPVSSPPTNSTPWPLC